MACQESWKLCDVMYVVFIMPLSFYFVKSCRIEHLYFKNDYFLELMVRWATRKLWGWWRVRSTSREEWVGKTSPCPVDQFPLYIWKHQVSSRELSDMWAECVGRGWILLLRVISCFSCGCGQTPEKKQLQGGRLYFGWKFEEMWLMMMVKAGWLVLHSGLCTFTLDGLESRKKTRTETKL